MTTSDPPGGPTSSSTAEDRRGRRRGSETPRADTEGRAPIRCDEAYATDLLRELVRAESINPDLDPEGSGEAEAAGIVSEALEALGWEVAVLEARPGRPSVLGRLAGTGGGRSLMLNGHLDTVGVEGMAEPFSAEVRYGRLHGRGAYDMKGAVAAAVAAARVLDEEGHDLAGDLWIAAVADEETESRGTREVIDHLEGRLPDAALVLEPTGLDLCIAHKGFLWFEIVARGRAAHGSRPELGVDANLAMARYLSALDRLRAELATGEAHPLLGHASLHVGTLRGGTAPSVYASECRARVEWRTLPGEDPARCLARLEALADELDRASDGAAGDGFYGTVELLLARPPFETTPGAPMARTAREALRRRGIDAELRGEGPWMDSALLAEAGVDTAVLGPAGAGAHADEEWVELDSVHRLAEVLADVAVAWCGSAEGG